MITPTRSPYNRVNKNSFCNKKKIHISKFMLWWLRKSILLKPVEEEITTIKYLNMTWESGKKAIIQKNVCMYLHVGSIGSIKDFKINNILLLYKSLTTQHLGARAMTACLWINIQGVMCLSGVTCLSVEWIVVSAS